MENLLIITPVKDSIVVASEAITRVCQSKKNYRYRVYNDRSLPESRTVLDHGSIIEEGSHQGLLEQGGHYAELYNTYFRHQSLQYVEEAGQILGKDVTSKIPA